MSTRLAHNTLVGRPHWTIMKYYLLPHYNSGPVSRTSKNCLTVLVVKPSLCYRASVWNKLYNLLAVTTNVVSYVIKITLRLYSVPCWTSPVFWSLPEIWSASLSASDPAHSPALPTLYRRPRLWRMQRCTWWSDPWRYFWRITVTFVTLVIFDSVVF